MTNILNDWIVKTGVRQFITEGPFDTLQILAISRDELSGAQYLYYASTLANEPSERHIFKVMITSTRTKTSAKCLTCDLGKQCLYNNAIFSYNAKYYVLECNGPLIPKIEIRRTEDNSEVLTLQTNDRLNNILNTKLLPTIEKMNVYIKGKGSESFLFYTQLFSFGLIWTDFSVMLYIPPAFRKDEIIKYPLLIQVLFSSDMCLYKYTIKQSLSAHSVYYLMFYSSYESKPIIVWIFSPFECWIKWEFFSFSKVKQTILFIILINKSTHFIKIKVFSYIIAIYNWIVWKGANLFWYVFFLTRIQRMKSF